MSIVGHDRAKNPHRGYTKTFLTQLADCLGIALDRGVRKVGNAGGLNPKGLAECIVRVSAEVADKVTTGQPIVWLEATKMKHTVNSPADGVLAELNVEPGRQVDVGAVLVRVDILEGNAA